MFHSWLLFKMIELTKNMRQKDDQPFTELLNRFRTASQTEADIQCIKSRLVHPEDTDYLVSIVCIFGTVFFCISCLFFIIIFSLLAPFLCSIVFFLRLIINFFFPFCQILYMDMLQSVFCSVLEYYISSIFLMASTSKAIPLMFIVY